MNLRGDYSYLLNSIVRNNSTEGRGGGVYLNKNATVMGCVISNNVAKDAGGGVACYESGFWWEWMSFIWFIEMGIRFPAKQA